MNGSFYISATGLRAQQQALDVIANNIANINTPGFKRSEVRFAELMASRASDGAGPADLEGLMAGVSATASPRVFAQGELKPTGKVMDLAIQGDGFIELMGPAGQALLWRGGTLKVNNDGELAAENGMALKAAISIPLGATNLAIDSEGKVSAQIDGKVQPNVIGQIDLVSVKDVTTLTSTGDGLYKASADGDVMTAKAGEDGLGVLVQGSLESSNVELSDEMVTLMLMQRAFSANAQVVQASDQLMSIVNGLKR